MRNMMIEAHGEKRKADEREAEEKGKNDEFCPIF